MPRLDPSSVTSYFNLVFSKGGLTVPLVRVVLGTCHTYSEKVPPRLYLILGFCIRL